MSDTTNTHGIILGRPTGGAVADLADGVKANSRSGYAADKYPHLLDAEERMGLATPIAGDRGAQRGRVPPAMRKTGHYGAVTATAADNLLAARRSGAAPRIENGLDSPGLPKDGFDDRMEAGDAPDQPRGQPAIMPASTAAPMAPPPMADPSAPPAWLGPLVQALTARPVLTGPGVCMPPTTPLQQVETVKPGNGYLEVRSTVQFGMSNGTYTVPVVDVRPGGSGLVIVLPLGGTHATFIPAARERFEVRFGKISWKCYYPGTAFEFPELGVMMLVLLQVSDEPSGTDSAADG